MVDLKFDEYYKYEELTDVLQAFEREYPRLVRLESLGKSFEGREIWLVRLTAFDRGSDENKPAMWIDANIHAAELSPSSACLYFINYLVEKYGTDERITRLLDSRAYYICPRVSPDGAEWALKDEPKIIRSGTRPYPYQEDPIGGLQVQDIDGDGRILSMRIPDDNGPWKAHPDEPRLLVRREPTETGGVYYRILPEGKIENYDGITIEVPRKKEGLDFNRNFPEGWRGEKEQKGAGPYPTSEPEVRAIVDFIARRPNLTAAISLHTHSAVLLRPYSHKADEEMPAEDLWTFEKIGDKGTEITGYPHMSVFHDFKYHPQKVVTGAFDDWTYEHLGLFSWTIEVWSPQQQAGIKSDQIIEWFREHPVEDDLKLLRWSDDELDGKGYVDWYEYHHPQLGPVELGGWDYLYTFRNPPPHLLEKELSLFPKWLVWHLEISPKLELFDLNLRPLGKDLYRIRLAVHNTGWLATYVTKKGLEKNLSRGVIFEIEIPDGAVLVSGKEREEKDHLEGRAYKSSSIVGWSVWNEGDSTKDRAKMEWVLRAPQGGKVKVIARQDRAGRIEEEVEIKNLEEG